MKEELKKELKKIVFLCGDSNDCNTSNIHLADELELTNKNSLQGLKHGDTGGCMISDKAVDKKMVDFLKANELTLSPAQKIQARKLFMEGKDADQVLPIVRRLSGVRTNARVKRY